jgi:molecular chaperone DnaK
VSLGASIQGAVLNKEDGVGDIVLLDVTPLNLGIETLGGVMTTLIEANTTIPCDKEEVFSTAADNQTEVTINILQGNRPMANQNKSIGRFNLTGILPAKRGIPQIAVKISINANGVIEVSATDKGTGKAQSIRVEGSSSLSKEEIERMKAEAEANADADKKEREIADAVNKGDNIVFSQEKMIEEQKDNITSDEKTKLEGLVSEMKQAVKDKNVEKINEIEGTINNVWNEISQRIYANNQNQSTAQQPSDEEVAEQPNDVQDAEFEEVKS